MTADSLVNGNPDAGNLARCIDGYGRSNFTAIEDFEDYVNLLDGQSKYFGEVWPNNANTVLCRSLELGLPENGSFPDTDKLLTLLDCKALILLWNCRSSASFEQ